MAEVWWKRRMLTFDLETTSVDVEQARIVSAAVAMVGGGSPTEATSWLVNPGVEIPAEATEVHGITNEMLQADGASPMSVLALITEFLKRCAGWPLVIFNARYDLTVLDRELRRLGMPGLWDLGPVVVDPIVVERFLDRYRPKRVASHSLEDCCKVWGVTLDGAHDATFDAIAAARLAYRLAQNGRVIRRTRNDEERREFVQASQAWERARHDLPALYAWQQEIAWAEAERLEAYFREGDPRKGTAPQPDAVVPRAWPIIPLSLKA